MTFLTYVEVVLESLLLREEASFLQASIAYLQGFVVFLFDLEGMLVADNGGLDIAFYIFLVVAVAMTVTITLVMMIILMMIVMTVALFNLEYIDRFHNILDLI